MDLKKFILVVLAFVIEIIFLSQDLKFSDNSDLKQDDISVKFEESKSYFISSQGIDKVLICKKIEQFPTYKKFYNPVATIYDKNNTKTILSKNAKFFDKNSTLVLWDNVKVIYFDKHLTTSKIIYDAKKQVVLDSEKFFLKSKSFDATGSHLYFDVKNNIIKAKNVKYRFKP